MNQKLNKSIDPAAHADVCTGDGDTAEYCRAKAHDLVQAAINRPPGDERLLLERSAAAWSMRAEQLNRRETRLTPPPAGPGPEVDDVRL